MSDRTVDRVDDADVVVVGAGLAGMTVALELASRARVTLLAAEPPAVGGSTPRAQGGIAAAVAAADSPAAHAADTTAVGGGLADGAVASMLADAGPGTTAWLAGLGVAFDRDGDGRPLLSREAGHSARRVLHAAGDRTGAEIARGVAAALAASPVRVEAPATAVRLLGGPSGVRGVLARHKGAGNSLVAHRAGAVVLATGGLGHLYARTTNPRGADGDAIALAARVGAVIADAEMVQFHPTALHVDQDPLPLLSEALRGDGAVLVDGAGAPLLAGHPAGSLAPRDVVARAVWDHVRAGEAVGLDARAIFAAAPGRFPAAAAACAAHGIDPATEPIPVTPAAHYHMGGVATDARGRTSVRGLWAAGEAAGTGLHGANRLASNSLLEAAVLGRRVAVDVTDAVGRPGRPRPGESHPPTPLPDGVAEDHPDPDALTAVRSILWRHVGVTRTAAGLDHAVRELANLADAHSADGTVGRAALAARMVAIAARERCETRGAHVRLDHPGTDPAQAHRRGYTLDLDGSVRPSPLPGTPSLAAIGRAG